MLEFINKSPVTHVQPYSAAVKAGNHVFVSPQNGYLNTGTNQKITAIEDQTVQCVENIGSALQAAGASIDDVVDMVILQRTNWSGLNKVLEPAIGKASPARTHIVTAFGNPDVLIMIGCTAYIPGKK